MAKLIGHITWSCLLRRSCFVSHQCRVSFRTYLRTSKRTGIACGPPGIQMDRITTASSHLQSCQSLVTVGVCCRCLWWGTWGAMQLRVAGVILRMLRRQAVVRRGGGFSAEELISARRSVLVANERKVQKAILAWSRGRTRRESCENVPSTILQPKSAWCVLFGGVWRKP